MTFPEILEMIAAALKDGDDGALTDIREHLQDMLMSDEELKALDNLIDAGLDSIGRESA